MKRLAASLLTVVALLAMSACGADQKNIAQTNSSTEEFTEVSSGVSEQVYTDPKKMKESYDVVIIGAGGAGMATTIEAKDAGLNPVILEKIPVAGGNTSKPSGDMNASETKFQKREGVKDSNDAFYEETLKGSGGTNDKEILRYFVDHSVDAVDWLDQNGTELDNLTITGRMNEERTHRSSNDSAIGGYSVERLLSNVHEREIPIFVSTDVIDIKKNGETVNGVTVHVQGKEPKEVTEKAIVVTTDGFGASKEFIEKYRPDLTDYITTNQEGSTGDGITMIEKLGGQTVSMDKIQIHPTVQQDEGVLIDGIVRGEGATLVDQEGKRFVNEMDTRGKVSAVVTALPEKPAYLIFDQGVRNHTTAVEHDLSSPNYYATRIAPGIHYTMGDVKINTNTEVLDKENQPIRELYAAGEVTGGLHGNNQIGGNSVAKVIILGRQAGIRAARFTSENE